MLSWWEKGGGGHPWEDHTWFSWLVSLVDLAGPIVRFIYIMNVTIICIKYLMIFHVTDSFTEKLM